MRNIYRKKDKLLQRGQTLFEALIALAIFALIVQALAAAAAGGFLGVGQGADQTYAHALLSSGIEAVHSVADRAWNELAYKQVSVATSSSGWQLAQSATPEQFDRFQRQIVLHDVCRSSTNTIVACPGAGTDYNDPHSKRVTVAVSWSPRPGVTSIASSTMQMTNWESQEWTQNDWSGGSGQAMWSATNKYNSQDGNIADSMSGQLTLRQTGGAWANHAPYSEAVTSQQIFDIAFVPGTNTAWAVGGGGVILYYNGSTWSSVVSPTTSIIYSVYAVSANQVWAAADAGRILFYNGTSWVVQQDTGSQQWNAIYMTSATQGWVVGSGGNIYRWNGTTWSAQVSPTSQSLNTVFMISGTDGWAAGNSGKLLRYNGTTWSEFIDTGSMAWNGIYLTSATSGWVVGSGGNIYRWNGTTWSLFSTVAGVTFQDISMMSASDGWAVGNTGKMYQWNGSTWTSVSSGTTRDFQGVAFTAAPIPEGFIVGQSGRIMRYVPVYASSGTLISSAFSLTDNSPVQIVEWDQTAPPSCSLCSIKFQLETAPDASGSPGTWTPTWTGPDGVDGDETDFFTIHTGERIPTDLNGNTWVRYRILFTGDGSATPTLTGMRVNYK